MLCNVSQVSRQVNPQQDSLQAEIKPLLRAFTTKSYRRPNFEHRFEVRCETEDNLTITNPKRFP